jgi:hypothetical protein
MSGPLEDVARVQAALGQLFIEMTVVPLGRFSPNAHDPEAAKIIADFQKHGSTHIEDWDGTLGSLVLGLSRKNDDYPCLMVNVHNTRLCLSLPQPAPHRLTYSADNPVAYINYLGVR